MEHKTLAKRLLALCLTLIILVGILPANVFARDFTRSSSEDLAYNAEPQRRSVKSLLLKRLLGGADAVDETLASKPNYWSQSQALNTQGLETYPAIAGEELDPGALGYPTALPGTSGRAVDGDGDPAVDWDKDANKDRDDGSSYWSLPAGVTIINAHNGPDPMNTFSFSYIGKTEDNEGRVVLKFDVGHRFDANTSWNKYVMRFPKELYNAIDRDKSFALWKQTEVYSINNLDKFTDCDIPGQQAFTYQFAYHDSGAQYQHREINVVLKKDVDWAKDFAGKSQVIQLRLFRDTARTLRIYSTSTRGRYNKFTSLGYNTHTKTAVVNDNTLRPKDLMESTTISMIDAYNDVFHSADSTLVLDKENKKVRIIYSVAKGRTTAPPFTPNDEYKHMGEDLALRQTLDPDFVRFLDLSDPNGKIGTYRLYNENEGTYGESIDLFASDLNGVAKDKEGYIEVDENKNPKFNRKDKTVFIQLGTRAFFDKENADSSSPEYIKTKYTAGSNFYNSSNNGNGMLGVFEYNIDPDRINATMITDNVFSKNFMFDTRYITSNNGGMRKFTGTVQKDIVYKPSKDNFYRIKFKNGPSLAAGVTGDDPKKQDFILNIGGPDGIWKSWSREGWQWFTDDKSYAISPYGCKINTTPNQPPIGGIIKAGTPITVYLPARFNATEAYFDMAVGVDNSTNVRTGVSLTNNQRVTLTKVKKPNGKDIFYDPMYIKNSVSTVGGSAVRERYMPIVDEIFTDSKEFTGIARTEGGVSSIIHMMEEINSNGSKYKQLRQYLGSSWLESTSDRNGDPDYYYRSDGKDDPIKIRAKDEDKYFASRRMMGHGDNGQLVNKEYKGYLFSIKNNYAGEENGKPVDSINKAKDKKLVENLGLIKDQAVCFSTYRNTSLKSDPVYEQVQAKVTFKVYDNTEIVRTVPLNTEYSIIPLKVDNKGQLNRDEAGKINTNYKGNGFKAQDGKDNIRVLKDKQNKNTEVTIERTAYSYTNHGTKLETDNVKVTYPNFLNHNGYAYDLKNRDNDIAAAEKDEFIKRLYPDARYDLVLTQGNNTNKKRPDDAVVIGWTTKKLTGPIEDQMDEFYKLKKGTKTDRYAYTIRNVGDWKNVDAEGNTQNYVFDEYSPVDKNRTVYAVWGVPCLVLHPNISDDLYNEKVVRIPVKRSMMDYTDEAIDKLECKDIDVITKPTERPAQDLMTKKPDDINNYHTITLQTGSNISLKDSDNNKIYMIKTKTDWTWSDIKALAEKLVKPTNPTTHKYLKASTDKAGSDEIGNWYKLNTDKTIYLSYTDTGTTTNTCSPESLSATKEDYKKQVIVISDIPKAPYIYNDTEGIDERLKDFRKPKETFVGWRAVSDPEADNKTIKAELDKFDAGLQNNRISYFLGSQALKETERYGYLLSKNSAYLPNGYKLWVSADDRHLKQREEFFTQVKDIHLYAMYRPYFEVTVEPDYKTINRDNAKEQIDPDNIQYGDFGKYTDYSGNKRALNIALITRTAVTPFTAPTVAQNATYNPIIDIAEGQAAIQKWDPQNPDKKPTWILPGYDEIGRRKSYVSVIIPDGKNSFGVDFREAYRDFGSNFDEGSWKKLGITTYLKLSGTSIDPSSPRNIHEWVHNEKELGDKYGDALAKKQSFTVKKNVNSDEVDIFTAATSRISKLVQGKQEISGYRIQLTASPEEIPTPQFERIRDKDKEIKLGWPGNGHTTSEYQQINKLKFDAQYITPDNKGVDYKKFSFTKDDDTKEFINDDTSSPLKAQIVNGKLVFTGLDLKEKMKVGKEDATLKNVTVKYIKETTVGADKKPVETSATEAIVPVKTSKPVIKMWQTFRAEPKNNIEIGFIVPSALLDQVRQGSKYIAQKWDDTAKKWIDVGTRTLYQNDLKNNGYQGNSYTIEITGKVQDKDKIRIKSMEYNKDADSGYYDDDDKRAGAEDYFSLPNYSTRFANGEANADAEPRVTKNTEGEEYVTLDLAAPITTGKAKDETFRRTIDLSATFNEKLKELPDRKDGEKIKVEFGTKGPRGTEGNIVKYFESPNDVLDEVGVVERTPEMEGPNGKGLTGIWVSVVDKFGNATQEKDASNKATNEGKLTYEQSYQLRIGVKGESEGRSWLRIMSEKPNTKVTITVMRGGQKALEQEVNLTKVNEYEKFTLMKDNEKFKLKEGDELHFYGESTPGDGKKYTTNPFIITIGKIIN